MKRSISIRLGAIIFLSGTVYSCAGPPAVEEPIPKEEPVYREVVSPLAYTPEVRVLILEAKSSVRIQVKSAFFLGESESGEPLKRFEQGGNFVVRKSGNRIGLFEGRKKVHEAPIVSVKPALKENIYINGKPYRGWFLFRLTQGGIMTVNHIEVDDYIKGVLPAEIGYLRSDQYEAYRVQAIASRSYALGKAEEKEIELYDLKATIMDQVYRGVQGETPEASLAVDETRGIVGIWEGKPIRAYYSACCGGHTADIRVSWPWKTPYPYLYGIRDTGAEDDRSFCRRSPHFRWRVHWSGRILERIIQRTLPKELGIRPGVVGKLTDLKVLGTAPDGRIIGIEIVTDRGSYRVDGDRIRWILKPNPGSDAILKSTLFKMSVKRVRGKVSAVNLTGGGNGHGVGMCQAGAISMAEQGYSAEEILQHYYPGVTIYRYYP